MKYSVNLFTGVRVKVVGVEAQSAAEAMQKAEGVVNMHDLVVINQIGVSGYPLDWDGMAVECVEWAEGGLDWVSVDPLLDNGTVDYSNVCFFGPDGEVLENGETAEDRKIAGYNRATLFMEELLDSVETLTGIAEQYGARTLADLMYLHSAILSGNFINHIPLESSVLEFASSLPSGERWVKFICIRP